MELEFGAYIDLVAETKDGYVSVAPALRFINHVLNYRDSKMPLASAVMTMPLVLPDGSVLAENGLNRKYEIVFRIEPELLGYIPKQEDCDDDAITKAFRFLADEWGSVAKTDGQSHLPFLIWGIRLKVKFARGILG